MTRIIGGSAGGRRLATPRGSQTRPTSDRVREALFSAVEAWCGSLDGLRFLDLYAGSGAVGLEAWSRGAGVVTLVEQDRRTAALIARNADDPRLRAAPTCWASRSPPCCASRRRRRTTWSSWTRPTRCTTTRWSRSCAALVEGHWLVPGALVVVERASRGPALAWPDGLVGERSKKYGETMLWYGHRASRDPGPEPPHR